MASRETNKLFEVTAKKLRCNHAITGLAPANKLCARCYDCATCPYDQMLEDMAPIYPTPVERPQAWGTAR